MPPSETPSSVVPEGFDRLDSAGAARRRIACSHDAAEEDDCCDGRMCRVHRTDTVERAFDQLDGDERGWNADQRADRGLRKDLSDHHPDDGVAPRPERDANADFTRAPLD